MSEDLFAGVCVTDAAAAFRWYGDLFGAEPAFFPHPKEAVWQTGEHRYVYVVERPERAGSSELLQFVDHLDARLAAIGARGLVPAREEAHEGGVRKVTFVDPDGNEISLGGQTAE